MVTTKEMQRFYAAMMSAPGMKQEAKISFKVPCKVVMYLSKVIELGLAVKDDHEAAGFLQVADAESVEKIKAMSAELLHMADLTESYESINDLNTKS